MSPALQADRSREPGIVCAGGAVLDRLLHLLGPAVAATSNPARATTSAGGVARNVAENLALLGVRVRLVSRVGDDDAGREVLSGVASRGVDVSAVAVVPGESTAQYVAVLDPAGDLVIGVAAMGVLDGIAWPDVGHAWPGAGEWLFLDCNLPAAVIAAALARARDDGTPVAVDAVSTPKVARLALAGGPDGVAVLFCNLDEGRALLAHLSLLREDPPSRPVDDHPPAVAGALVRAGARAVVLTMGPAGALIADGEGIRAVPAVPADVVDVTGAGDALVAATLACLHRGGGLDDAVRCGVVAAARTVAGTSAVRGVEPVRSPVGSGKGPPR